MTYLLDDVDARYRSDSTGEENQPQRSENTSSSTAYSSTGDGTIGSYQTRKMVTQQNGRTFTRSMTIYDPFG